MRTAKPPELTGEQVRVSAQEFAQQQGWIVAHFRPAKTSHGYRTPVEADGKGFPDLVLVRAGNRVLYRECKSELEKLTPDQEKWRDVLLAAGEDWAVWDYRDWPDVIVKELLRRDK